ncbi:MarR family winged helix-turn-helix transcriptional regulator [Pseudoalteromonas piratica]|uniref:MarR family transcriptional regulator n=1 Tax=Pseudoalteromonas piratica TaxID=1348114 RepID=A0A0A7EM12_9GAMM|nr:MarR family transcriptional regulator [Pseudoalteromonas piratica]AIY67578.1 MarR family transcriptional regulator [Pseudoalteromonas piratica]
MTANKRQTSFKLSKKLDKALDLYQQVPYRIATASNLLALDRDANVKHITHLDTRAIRVLLNIGSYGPINAADIAYQTRLDPYSVTRAINGLLKEGLIQAANDHSTSRSKFVELSEAGTPIYQNIASYMAKRCEDVLDGISDEEQTLLMTVLEKIELNTERMLAQNAQTLKDNGGTPTRDQSEQIRWFKRTQKQSK